MRDICISTVTGHELPLEQRLELYQTVGFDAVMLWLGRDLAGATPEQQLRTVHASGLRIENCHADYRDVNAMWVPGEAGDRFTAQCLQDLEAVSAAGVKRYVFHLTRGENPPDGSPVGRSRLETLIAAAERLGVCIALENLRKPELLREMLAAETSPAVGFCFDSGHRHCWTPEVDWLTLYGSRLAAIHLHDNGGREDEHLLPGDGTVDFGEIVRSLRAIGYRGGVGIESDSPQRSCYNGWTLRQYLEGAKRAGQKIRAALDAPATNE